MLVASHEAASSAHDDGTAKILKRALCTYCHSKSETSCKNLIVALEAVCSSLCFGDELFIRCLDAGLYANVLVSTLINVSSHKNGKLRTLTVQVLALLADLVPHGGLAIASAKGISPLLCLVQSTDPHGNEVFLEEVLKCISHIAVEAHDQMVRENAIAILINIEAGLDSHHLRMICLKCLCHLLASVEKGEWNRYLAKPCAVLIKRFHNKVHELLKGEKAAPLERLPKESELYLLRLTECLAFVFDRLLRTGDMLQKNMHLVELAVSTLVFVLRRTASLGSQGVAFRDAVCSPLLTLFLTDTSVAVELFLRCCVVQTICSIITTVLDHRMRRLPHNGLDLAEAFLGNDVRAIPCVAEEQRIIPFLEFLLVVIPSALGAHDSDYYVTFPHYVWEWEDDFHNRSDCRENISKQLEREYDRQRKLSSFVPYDMQLASRILRVDFETMRYMSAHRTSYTHTIYRHPILAGYVHRRVMRCSCPDGTLPYIPPVCTFDKREVTSQRRNLKWSHTHHTDDGAILGATQQTTRTAGADDSVMGSFVGNEMDDALYHSDSRRVFTTTASLDTVRATSSLPVPGRERLVDETSCGCGNVCIGSPSRGKKRRTRKELHAEYLKDQAFAREVLLDGREEILRGSRTRSQFLQHAMIQVLVSWCLPTLVTVLKKSVNPTITRHSSILILRSVDLVAEYLRVWNKRVCNESQRKVYDKLIALMPQLGTALAYLATANGSLDPLTINISAFREFVYDDLFVYGLASLGLRPDSLVPAMSLTCEIQMTTFSTFLLLQYLLRDTVDIFTGTQRLLVLDKLKALIGSVSRHQSALCTAFYGSTGNIPCPFHSTTEVIEEVHRRMSEQVYLLLQEETEEVFEDKLGSFEDVLSYTDHMGSKNGCSNPLVAKSSQCTSSCINQAIFIDINARANTYRHHLLGIREMLALYDYLQDNGNDLSSLIYGNWEFVANMAETLHDIPVSNIVFDAGVKEAFVAVSEALECLINEHTGLVNVELTSAIERLPSRFSRRFRRSKIMMAMSDCMWTPLKIKLESVSTAPQRGQLQSPSSRTLVISGNSYTILGCGVELNIFAVLPTTPLNYIAKYILFHLQQQNAAVSCKQPPHNLLRREMYDSENDDFNDSYNTEEFLLSGVEVRDYEDDDNPSFRSLPRITTIVGNTQERVDSSLRFGEFPLKREGVGCEHILSVVSTTVPVSGQPSHYVKGYGSEDGNKELSNQEDNPYATITVDNIIFLCNDEPITDLSISALELCCKSSQALSNELAYIERSGVGYSEESPQSVQRLLALCSAMHIIQYVVVKESLVWETNEVEDDDDEEKRLRSTYHYPKDVFGRLFHFPEPQHSLDAAAKLLDELWGILHMTGIRVSHDEGRLCSALLHGFYNYLPALMLPPLEFHVLWTYLNGQKDQHAASYILWSYPQVFSFDIRQHLLHLLLSVRRVPASGLLLLKEAMKSRVCMVPLHGLEWITPELNMSGTKKVTVQRDNILESGAKVLRGCAMCPLPLSVEFENENGVGVGPAMEFYSLFSAKLQEESLQMWQTEEYTNSCGVIARRVQLPLFPAASQTMKSLSYFELLGLLVGRVLMEERVVDLPLHRCFIRGILGQLDQNHLEEIDPKLNQQLLQLNSFSAARLEACGLFFVVPDCDIELCRNGAHIHVVTDNLAAYIHGVRRHYCVRRLLGPLRHFLQGLRYAVVPHHLRLFTPGELQLLIAGPDGLVWQRPEDLARDLNPAHGYHAHSAMMRALCEVVCAWDAKMQRAFLQFITGSTRIPLGGLHPPITVVRRAVESGDEWYKETASPEGVEEREMVQELQQQLMDQSLPTVNTCVHYLKLPSYSSKAILKEKLWKAVLEGQKCFLLT